MMYKGNNATALQSMDWLATALTNLMDKTAYSKITIRDLCLEADLSRQTFYNVFSTKDEVMHYCLQKQYKQYFHELTKDKLPTMNEIIDAFITFSEENTALLRNMIENQLEGIITDEITNSILFYVEHFIKPASTEMLPYSAAMLSGALAQLILCLFKQDTKIDSAQLTQLLQDFFQGNIYRI